jgi:hypothetical protein
VTEVLVLLRASAHVTARDLAQAAPLHGAGVQVFGDRVLTARMSLDACAEIAAMDGVEGLFPDEVPAELLPDDPVGRLSVQAWNSRRAVRREDNDRIGDGAAWDDPRFAREGRPGKTKP